MSGLVTILTWVGVVIGVLVRMRPISVPPAIIAGAIAAIAGAFYAAWLSHRRRMAVEKAAAQAQIEELEKLLVLARTRRQVTPLEVEAMRVRQQQIDQVIRGMKTKLRWKNLIGRF